MHNKTLHKSKALHNATLFNVLVVKYCSKFVKRRNKEKVVYKASRYDWKMPIYEYPNKTITFSLLGRIWVLLLVQYIVSNIK